jgi:hypothetical protein
MDRVVLLALLGIPILVIMHVALFWQSLPPGAVMFSAADGAPERPHLQGYWQAPERLSLPSRFVIRQTSEQGS